MGSNPTLQCRGPAGASIKRIVGVDFHPGVPTFITMQQELPQLKCGWCGTVGQEGSLPPSHGICEGCMVEIMDTLTFRSTPLNPHQEEPKWARWWRDWGGEA